MLYIFRFKSNTLLCYTVVSVLVLSIGIGRCQQYWLLGALFGIVLTLSDSIAKYIQISAKTDTHKVVHCWLKSAKSPFAFIIFKVAVFSAIVGVPSPVLFDYNNDISNYHQHKKLA